MSALDRQEERERQIRELIREKTNLSGPVLYNLAAQITLLSSVSPVGVPLSDYEEALEEKDNIIIQLEEQCGNLEDSLQAGQSEGEREAAFSAAWESCPPLGGKEQDAMARHFFAAGLAAAASPVGVEGHITEFQKGAEWMADRLAFTAVSVEGLSEAEWNCLDFDLGGVIEGLPWPKPKGHVEQRNRESYRAKLAALAASPSSPTGQDAGLREAAQHLEVIAHDLTRTDLEPNLHLIERRVELAYERVIAALNRRPWERR